jgi:predicted nucleic-acid-binding Zn-ribbon protein
MKKTGKCPKCASAEIIADAHAVDRGDHHLAQWSDATVATFRDPNALIFRGKQVSTISAWVCAVCGFVEYYADYPENIRVPRA